MKLLRRKEGPSLESRLAALLEAASLADGRLSERAVSGARAVAGRAGVRRSLSVEHTVAALAGATGSGKSSLYNALAGEDLAAVGVTRPTTATAQAALWDGEGAGPLLDWLDVPRRHSAPAASDLSGLVLLDLPDHDSIRLSHRLEVDRLVELVDLLVWVVDPQKYADAALHERYLRPLARHRDVMLVVLNQVDRLPPQAVDRCVRDLRRLLEDDGLGGVPVLAVSARTGTGMPDFRALLGDRVSERKSWSARLAADITTAADHLATAGPVEPAPRTGTKPAGPSHAATRTEAPPHAAEGDGEALSPSGTPEPPASGDGRGGAGREAVSGDGREGARGEAAASGDGREKARRGSAVSGGGVLMSGRVPQGAERQEAGRQETGGAADGAAERGERRVAGLGKALTRALSDAAGVPLVVEAVAKGHRHRAVVATGWPVTRWVRKFRPDPLRRLRIGAMAPSARPGREIVGRTSVPAASAVQRAQVETAIRDVGEAAAAGLPGPWEAAVRQAARSRTGELADAVDKAVARTSVGATKRPRWWRVVNVLQWLVFLAMVVGALWLGVLFGMDYLRLPPPPLPTVGVVPWPTVSLVGGAVAGVLVALLSRLAAWAGGRRRARRTARALREAVGQVGKAYVLDPVEAELDRYARFVEALDLARAGADGPARA
ncbi:GTPase [Nonomuraea jiangxiensis]|uniref:50S ribosome-binding GTPase n=1 Tax=Nonomuraea jiangxiensis TaxID=633440 RepID=A0A1G9CJR6_9ACTN|nr:GTPase [Nonomuraea jiangxiensis]SDK51921.1 50S ribosome-binding GTPase [Nonomuraea jiangxiensis]